MSPMTDKQWNKAFDEWDREYERLTWNTRPPEQRKALEWLNNATFTEKT